VAGNPTGSVARLLRIKAPVFNKASLSELTLGSIRVPLIRSFVKKLARGYSG
jgi:hypothetical protein